MNKGNENKAHFLKFPRFHTGGGGRLGEISKISYRGGGGAFESMYLENNYITIMVLNVLLYIFKAKKVCQKKI